jgi:lysophospholipase L1-like esterase
MRPGFRTRYCSRFWGIKPLDGNDQEEFVTKVVVCFGDSNTWGAKPDGSGRFAADVRWTGVLQAELGPDYKIIEEGLNGRTTNIEDTIEEDRNGRKHLPVILESHRPFDLIVIMLGTNDLKGRNNRSAADIAQSASKLADIARKSMCGPNDRNPRVLVMAPPATVEAGHGLDMLFAGSVEKSQHFPKQYAFYAQATGVDFFDAGSVIVSSPVDGIHFDADQHAKLGKAVAAKVKEILG